MPSHRLTRYKRVVSPPTCRSKPYNHPTVQTYSNLLITHNWYIADWQPQAPSWAATGNPANCTIGALTGYFGTAPLVWYSPQITYANGSPALAGRYYVSFYPAIDFAYTLDAWIQVTCSRDNALITDTGQLPFLSPHSGSLVWYTFVMIAASAFDSITYTWHHNLPSPNNMMQLGLSTGVPLNYG